MIIGQAQIDDFATDGAVVIRQAFTLAEVDLLAAGIEANLAAPGPLHLVASGRDDPGYFVEDFCNWTRIHQYEDFIKNSAASTIARQLMQSRQVRLHHDHLLVKEAGTKQRTPWHQDQPYYNITGMQNVSMWMPVDPVPLDSSPEFLAGSHLGPWLMPRTFQDNQAKWFPEGSLGDLPDIESDRGAYRILGWALEPGDAVFFHMLTLHAAAGTKTRRRAFSVRFIGDDARHAARPWSTSPQFPGLDAELPDGAPFEHPLFPLLAS